MPPDVRDDAEILLYFADEVGVLPRKQQRRAIPRLSFSQVAAFQGEARKGIAGIGCQVAGPGFDRDVTATLAKVARNVGLGAEVVQDTESSQRLRPCAVLSPVRGEIDYGCVAFHRLCRAAAQIVAPTLPKKTFGARLALSTQPHTWI
jgi:hypothetical protein